MNISLLHKSSVSPLHPTHAPAPLFLTAFDLRFQSLPYQRKLLFYFRPSAPAHSFHQIVSRLKHSLSSALLHFYPFAGRFALAEDGSGRLEIDCNDAGVEFVEAVCSNCTIQQVGDLWAKEPPEELQRIAGDPEARVDLSERPLLCVQVTKFLCGSFSVCCAYSHVVADGHSFWQFVKYWAKICRGDDAISQIKPDESIALHHRHIWKVASAVNDNSAAAPKVVSIPPRTLRDMEDKSVVVQLSKEALQRLKDLANEEGSGSDGRPFSTYEALCAHFWRGITRARLLSDEQETKLSTPVNVRRRVKPPLPDAYFGNFVTRVVAASKVGDLMKGKLSYSASLFHDAIASCNDAKIKGVLEFLERGGDFPRLGNNDVLAASSPRFPQYEADFVWGKPTLVRPGLWMQGLMFVDPGARDGSVDVSVALAPLAMDRFLNDSEFLSFLSL